MDDELLEEELGSSWTRRGRPAGANAIIALAVALTLVLWLATLVVMATLLQGPAGSGVVEPRSLGVLAVLGAEMFIGPALARRLWVAIGPGLRAALRPLGVLGPWPLLLLFGFAALVLIVVLKGAVR
jgi:hypothetical protein